LANVASLECNSSTFSKALSAAAEIQEILYDYGLLLEFSLIICKEPCDEMQANAEDFFATRNAKNELATG
jgi:hypothetical protein